MTPLKKYDEKSSKQNRNSHATTKTIYFIILTLFLSGCASTYIPVRVIEGRLPPKEQVALLMNRPLIQLIKIDDHLYRDNMTGVGQSDSEHSRFPIWSNYGLKYFFILSPGPHKLEVAYVFTNLSIYRPTITKSTANLILNVYLQPGGVYKLNANSEGDTWNPSCDRYEAPWLKEKYEAHREYFNQFHETNRVKVP